MKRFALILFKLFVIYISMNFAFLVSLNLLIPPLGSLYALIISCAIAVGILFFLENRVFKVFS